jgi:hypothetical protein
MHLEDGHHVVEVAAEAAEEREHHLAIADGVAELGEGCSHGLEATTVVSDAQGLLTKIAELRLEEKSTRLLLPEKLILEVAPCTACGTLAYHQRLLQVTRDGAIDPCEDTAVRLDPGWVRGEDFILENVSCEGIFAKHGEEDATPFGVGVHGLVKDDGD